MGKRTLSRQARARRAVGRRVLAVAGLVPLAAALLPAAAGSSAQVVTPSAAQASAARASRARASTAGASTAGASTARVGAAHAVKENASRVHAHAGSQVTVTGPKLWDPSTGAPLKQASQVTVSQTSNLVDQLVHVTWRNFTPSSPNNAPGPWYSNTGTFYAVMAVECKGTDPTSYADCYEADSQGLQLPSGPAGPPNNTFAITTSGGTGQLNFEVETSLENSVLGCDQNRPCSLVIVPGQGGIPAMSGQPAQCTDHRSDVVGSIGYAIAEATFDFSSPSANGFCSWNDRIVIPLHFAPVPTGCPQRQAAFSMAGSPMMAVAMSRWLAGLCAGRHGLTIGYDSTTGEPAAITEAADGLADVALTTRPASADGLGTGTKKYVYAPIAISGASIAYWLDNNITGQPLSGVKLNQRLMAKLLTTSYNPDISCKQNNQPAGCDGGVDHNPFSLLYDPEFKSLNPSIDNKNTISLVSAQPRIVPSVPYGESDLTWALTNWIAANGTASGFLSGSFDPWGTHVNTYYLGLKYPVNQFTAQDPTAPWTDENQPVSPLSQEVTYQALNEDAGSDTPTQQPGGGVVLGKDPAEPLGNRALIAVVDQGDAALNNFPTAEIPNAAGKYVGPSNAGMAAAIKNMISDGSGTLQVNEANTDPAAYPLTMVIYAMAPISGETHAKAAAIARFLDFAAGAGQKPGALPGQLAAGYLPLPSSMRKQTRTLANEVLHQTGDSSSSNGNGTGNGSGNGNGTGNGAGGGTGSGTGSSGNGSTSTTSKTSPSGNPGAAHHPVSLVDANAGPGSILRFLLPVLLIAGLLLALAGGSAMAGAEEGGIPGVLRRARRRTVTMAHRVSRVRPAAVKQLGRKP